jgi:hypothetical protein
MNPGNTQRDRKAAGENAVAQISNLLYRRLPVGGPSGDTVACGLEIRDTAGWKPALRPGGAQFGTSDFGLRTSDL